MSCCQSVKCRNTGSGYVKSGGAGTESNKKLDELLAARAAQDSTYFPSIRETPTPQSNICHTGICIPPSHTKSK
jgi:hypothetical protein